MGIYDQLASEPAPYPIALENIGKARLAFTSSIPSKLDGAQPTLGFQLLSCEWQGGRVTKYGMWPSRAHLSGCFPKLTTLLSPRGLQRIHGLLLLLQQ